LKARPAHELACVATDSATPNFAQFGIAQVGQTAYHRLRWVNPTGQAGGRPTRT
jgi:hypothetical protein